MICLYVKVQEYDLEVQPGYIKCAFTDYYGNQITIEEKIPTVFSDYVFDHSEIQDGFLIPGAIVNQEGDRVLFSTVKPYGISSVAGETEFNVHINNLKSCD